MQPQVCVFSIGITSRAIKDEIKLNRYEAQFVFFEKLLREDTKLPDELKKYEVFLSSGYNADMLRKITEKPIISIDPSVYDILVACSKAAAFDETPTVITYEKDYLVNHISDLSGILGWRIHIAGYDKTDEIEDLVLRLKERGQKCVIGSGLVCESAKRNGMESIYLYPKETICRSLQTASELAVGISQTNEKNMQLENIIDHSKQGIVFADKNGFIFHCNSVAQNYLDNGGRSLIGQALNRYIEKDDVYDMYHSQEQRQYYRSIRGSQYVINAIPLISKQKISSLLLYIDDVLTIQKTDRFIRREVKYQNAFIARSTFDQYETRDEKFQRFISMAKKFARTEEPIVILGETGTGKEVLAQSIHNYSNRANHAFVAVNCAAIPEDLFESELFGYNEGAFTGAKKGGKEGYFELAHTGTIFLDEIAELTLAEQSKLLRVIQEKQLLRVGGTKPIPFDVRIIVATNQNLWKLVKSGKFRSDFYYRLNVLELDVPPLRERRNDVLMLFKGFLDDLEPGLWGQLTPYSDVIGAKLNAYSWPGNVRELKNFTHMLVAMWQSEPDNEIRIQMLSSLISKRSELTLISDQPQNEPLDNKRMDNSATRDVLFIEWQQIKKAMKATNNNCTEAAELLGIHRTTLWRKIKKYNEIFACNN